MSNKGTASNENLSNSKAKTRYTLTEEDRAAAAESRLSYTQSLPNMSTVLYRRDRTHSEYPTRAAAIRNQCRHCVGYEGDGQGTLNDAVENCMGHHCWLYPWRLGKIRLDDDWEEDS